MSRTAARFRNNEIVRKWKKKIQRGMLSLGGVSTGNEILVYTNGQAYFDDLWTKIKGAENSVWIECYHWEPDKIGHTTIDILAEAASRGCDVRVIYDHLGSFNISESDFDRIRKEGGKVFCFNPIWPLSKSRPLLFRNHRKLCVVDEGLAFTGGMNLSEEYLDKFRDTHIRVKGDAVHDLAKVFWHSTLETMDINAVEKRLYSIVHRMQVMNKSKDSQLVDIEGNPIASSISKRETLANALDNAGNIGHNDNTINAEQSSSRLSNALSLLDQAVSIPTLNHQVMLPRTPSKYLPLPFPPSLTMALADAHEIHPNLTPVNAMQKTSDSLRLSMKTQIQDMFNNWFDTQFGLSGPPKRDQQEDEEDDEDEKLHSNQQENEKDDKRRNQGLFSSLTSQFPSSSSSSSSSGRILQRGDVVDGNLMAPSKSRSHNTFVQVLQSNGLRNVIQIHNSLIYAISNAEEKVYITNPYFLPYPRLRIAIESAARRGVDVKIITGGDSDVFGHRWAGQHVYGRFLESGVKIFEMYDKLLHAKTVQVDSLFSSIGSFNMDGMSWNRNLELNTNIVDKEVVNHLESQFQHDLQWCKEVELNDLQDRTWTQRFAHWGAYHLFRRAQYKIVD